LGQVLFDVFDAKANAETSLGVGFNWDVQILFPDSRMVLPKALKESIEAGWETWARSPFKQFDPHSDLPEPDGWPTDWKRENFRHQTERS
jgi:hypothetical protein